MKPSTCPHCGKRFIPWRAKRYCSESCRKHAQNARLGYVGGDPSVRHNRANYRARAQAVLGGMNDPSCPITNEAQNPGNPHQGFQGLTADSRRDEEAYPPWFWTACKEITVKLTRKGSPDAIAWVFQIRDRGWFMRIKPDLCFGPSTRMRAQKAAEATIMGVPFDKIGDERSWRGDCMAQVLSAVAERKAPAGVLLPPVEMPEQAKEVVA
jgi:hypothetical protein